jgi:AcrR family transcriptional regulator
MLAAMSEVCSELGAANVTVAHVVARSGVSRRTFYEQFSDIEDCFVATLEDALQCARRYVLPAYESDGRWRERIRAALIGLLSFLEDEPYMGRLLVVETLAGGELALRRRQEVLARIDLAVDEARGEAKANAQPPPLTAEGAVGSVVSILHARLAQRRSDSPLLSLTGQLMSMLVLPYFGTAAARSELRRPMPMRANGHRPARANPLHDLSMRLTYRTVRVLQSVASRPGSSNRELASAAEVPDQGQMSKLLTRLQKLGLIENTGAGHARGGPNAWTLTGRGCEVQRTLGQQATGAANG